MIPVYYWQMCPSDLPIADAFNSANYMVWHPGRHKHFRDVPSQGWHKLIKNRKKHYAPIPQASWALLQARDVKRFLRRRVRQLSRSGGFYLIWVKTFDPIPEESWHSFSIGLAHHRHRGPSSPLELLTPFERLPKLLRIWFPAELPHGRKD